MGCIKIPWAIKAIEDWHLITKKLVLTMKIGWLHLHGLGSDYCKLADVNQERVEQLIRDYPLVNIQKTIENCDL